MNEYRLRSTGAVYADPDFRLLFSTSMLPANLSVDDLDSLDADPVLPAPQPEAGPNQFVVRVGAVQNAADQWVQGWLVHNKSPQETSADLASRRFVLLAEIDRQADAIYTDAVGVRALEYQMAAVAAATFKTAGYAGEVPAGVQSLMDARGWGPGTAADAIVEKALAWEQTQDLIRRLRQAIKQRVRDAADLDSLSAACADWIDFVNATRTGLGLQ